MRKSPPFALSLVLVPVAAWAAANPEAYIHRKAEQHDRQVARELDRPSDDDKYLVAPQEALQIAIDVLNTAVPVAEISDRQVASDWKYDVETGTDSDGEWATTTRTRAFISLAGGPEYQTTVRTVSERSEAHAGKGTTTWKPLAEPSNLTASLRTDLHRKLAAAEHNALDHLPTDLNREQLSQYVAAYLPAGWTITPDDAALIVEHVETLNDSNDKKGLRATWDHRQRVTVRLVGAEPTYDVLLAASDENRFSVQDTSGSWEPADITDTRPMTKLRHDIVAAAIDHFTLGAQNVPMPDALHRELTPAPILPILRTRAQLEAEDTDKQRAADLLAGSGWYRLKLEDVTISPTKRSGQAWDWTPGRSLARAAGAGVAVYTGGLGANAASQMAEELAASMPTDPDVQGGIAIGTQSWPLPLVQDNLHPSWAWQTTVPFSRNGPTIAMAFDDLDALDSNDRIGQCQVSLLDLITDGGRRTFACGDAQVTLLAEWQRSL